MKGGRKDEHLIERPRIGQIGDPRDPGSCGHLRGAGRSRLIGLHHGPNQVTVGGRSSPCFEQVPMPPTRPRLRDGAQSLESPSRPTRDRLGRCDSMDLKVACDPAGEIFVSRRPMIDGWPLAGDHHWLVTVLAQMLDDVEAAAGCPRLRSVGRSTSGRGRVSRPVALYQGRGDLLAHHELDPTHGTRMSHRYTESVDAAREASTSRLHGLTRGSPAGKQWLP